jgi:uncharacterized protein (TIGR03437 family)
MMHEVSPALFTLGSVRADQGLGFIVGGNELAMPRQEGSTGRPAVKGEHISIFANGLGRVAETVLPGEAAPLDRLLRLTMGIRVLLGDIEVEPLFAGLAPGEVGVYQIDVSIPDVSPVGPAVPLYIEVVLNDGSVVTSNTVTLAIEEPSPAP